MISVIIPVRAGGNCYNTICTLGQQTLQPDEIIISWDEGHGANWARNRGFEKSRGDLVVFSDDDIHWLPHALEQMHGFMERYLGAAFVFGTYEMDGKEYCNRAFSTARLRENSCVSTMSMIRRSAFPGFDESIRRLQDWDLFLTMVENGHTGMHCGSVIFGTQKRDGITEGPGAQDWQEARDIVARKHGL